MLRPNEPLKGLTALESELRDHDVAGEAVPLGGEGQPVARTRRAANKHRGEDTTGARCTLKRARCDQRNMWRFQPPSTQAAGCNALLLDLALFIAVLTYLG